MGYEIYCTDSSFRLAKPRAALVALKEANRQTPLFDFEDIPDEVEQAETIEEALEACCWDVEADADGRVERLFYEGKLLTGLDDLERFFTVLAPFVRSGSYLRIEGEDDDTWEYRFAGGRFRVR